MSDSHIKVTTLFLQTSTPIQGSGNIVYRASKEGPGALERLGVAATNKPTMWISDYEECTTWDELRRYASNALTTVVRAAMGAVFWWSDSGREG
jgi:hypothetical protein